MTKSMFTVLDKTFYTVCIIAAIGFTGFCIQQYIQNDDASVVTFEEYHKNADSIYPSVSLCFSNYIRNDAWNNYSALNEEYALFQEAVKKDDPMAFNPTDVCKDQRTLDGLYLKHLLGKPLYEKDCNKLGVVTSTSLVDTTGGHSSSKCCHCTKWCKGGTTTTVVTMDYCCGEEKCETCSTGTTATTGTGTGASSSTTVDVSKDVDQNVSKILDNMEDQFSRVPHDNVIINITDFLLLASVVTDGYERIIFDNEGENKTNDWKPKYYMRGNIPERQCWTFEMPFLKNLKKIMQFALIFNSAIFRDSSFPGKRPESQGFEVKLSYPGQESTARVSKINWKDDTTYDTTIMGGTYTMKFDIQNMVVLHKRNKHGEQCMENWNEYDGLYYEKELTNSGIPCKPPYWMMSLNTTLLPCSDEHDLKRAYNLLSRKHDVDPCYMVEKILYSYDEMSGLMSNKEFIEEPTRKSGEKMFQVLFEFQGGTFMKITQTRAYDVQSLIGNAGGYIGVFLGVALIQLPAFLLSVLIIAKKLIRF